MTTKLFWIILLSQVTPHLSTTAFAVGNDRCQNIPVSQGFEYFQFIESLRDEIDQRTTGRPREEVILDIDFLIKKGCSVKPRATARFSMRVISKMVDGVDTLEQLRIYEVENDGVPTIPPKLHASFSLSEKAPKIQSVTTPKTSIFMGLVEATAKGRLLAGENFDPKLGGNLITEIEGLAEVHDPFGICPHVRTLLVQKMSLQKNPETKRWEIQGYPSRLTSVVFDEDLINGKKQFDLIDSVKYKRMKRVKE